MQPTRWLPVPGYEGLYEVSDSGFVRSLDHITAARDGRTIPQKGRVLRIRERGSKKYATVALFRSGDRIEVSVHRLVAEVFIGPGFPDQEVCHNDGDVKNNAVDNLRWGTHAENMHDKPLHGTDYWSNRTHCKNGHEFTPENTWVNRRGWRLCKTCSRRSQREWRHRRSAND